ncbi:MAG: protein kinase, partial [Gemmataceae bacterium]|nr:protein kinase [Gemmataceae bacterium]
MSTIAAPQTDREQRLHQVLLAYVEAVQARQRPDRTKLLAGHPDLRDDLEAFFADYDEVECLTAPLREAAKAEADSSPFAPCSDAGSQLVLDHTPLSGDNEPKRSIGQLGDFRLLREVGRGGMGVVYEAEQISLQRRVALKVLPFAAALDPRRLQRFKNEAMAAGHLHHEHIVPVYAVGCERGVHYYAMQFVDGQSLGTLIDELRRREVGQAGA